ncbi:hypothetical protein KJ654_00775, partial [Patescibacteria group bacterium]|nr:hypothetical protein [Patescibacteria group bacterium]MBU1967510.1 hypothetical protein [Patescibacteria group bacterium]
MNFANFSKALEQLEQTPSRLEMTEQLAQLYQQLDTGEIGAAIYLMQGRLVPQYESLEFNLSTKMIQRALARLMERHQEADNSATTQSNFFGEENNNQFLSIVQQKTKKLGDLGLATAEILQELWLNSGGLNSSPSPMLQITEVFFALKK